MKNGLIIWNVVLSLVAGYLLFTHFGSGKKGSSVKPIAKNDSTGGISNGSFLIAYFDMDSVEANYKYVKDVKTEISQKEDEYTKDLRQLDVIYKNKYDEYASKTSMTQQEQEEAQNVLNQLSEKLKGQKQQLDQKYQEFVMRRNLDVKKEIEKFIQGYNESKRYSYIFAADPGLLYYKDTTYNITADVIKGLNDTYKPEKAANK